MNCLRTLSERHNIAVIASIHQPNNEIVLMFNKVYVLAKGGHCIHSGQPDDIELFLEECKILCDVDQVPVEELLILASIEEQNENIEQMIAKTKEKLRAENKAIENQMKVCPNGLRLGSKRFKLIDICHLMSRTMAQIRAYQWRVSLAILSFYIIFPVLMAMLFNKHMGQVSGCFEFNRSKTCAKDIEDDDKLVQNQTFIFFIVVCIEFVHVCCVTVSSIQDIRIFLHEYNNGKLFLKIRLTLEFS